MTKNNSSNETQNVVDIDVSDLYQSQPQQGPSAQIDKRILELATQKAQTSTKMTPVKWRKWQWPTSIAASIMFITFVVYNQYDRFDPMLAQSPSAQVDTFGIADQATLDKEQLARKSKLETRELTSARVSSRIASEPLLDKSEFTEDSMDEPERAQYAEKEALTLAARAMDNIEIEPITFDLELPNDVNLEQQIPDEIPLSQEEAESLERNEAALLAQQRIEIANRMESLDRSLSRRERLQEKESEEHQVLAFSGSKLMSADPALTSTKMQVNSEYLDSLLTQLKTQPEQSEQVTNQLRSDIFDYLSLFKTANPSVEIEQKYLQVLTDKQKRQLTE